MYGAIPRKLTKVFTRNLLKYPIGVVKTTNRKYLINCKMNANAFFSEINGNLRINNKMKTGFKKFLECLDLYLKLIILQSMKPR